MTMQHDKEHFFFLIAPFATLRYPVFIPTVHPKTPNQ